MSTYEQLAAWYKRVTWFGIFLNMLFVIPMFFVPSFGLSLLNLELEPKIWARISVMLLFIISVFYIPAAYDLKKYRIYAWIAIVPSRFCGATFFTIAVFVFGFPLGFLPIAIVDATILVLQLYLLLKIRKVEMGIIADDPGKTARHSRKVVQVLIVLVILLALFGYVGWYKLMRQVPQNFASMEEQFKYGSIGTEDAEGLPYWLWMVLPRVFPEHLPGPGGYYSLGMAYEKGQALPVGLSRKTIGFDRVGLNCAFCHAGTVRLNPNDEPTVYAGGASHTFDVLGYQRFLFACAKDPRFNADNIMAEISGMVKLGWLDRMLYRHLLIPMTRDALIKQSAQFDWTDTRPDWGRGRIDPFNPVKVRVLDVEPGDTIGNSDMVPIWNLKPRLDMVYHWDGMQTDINEVMNSSAIGDGATYRSIPLEKLQDMKNWLINKQPPEYPYINQVDRTLADAGKVLYDQLCAECHAFGSDRVGTVIPQTEVGTDPHRMQMWTNEAAEAYNNAFNGKSFDFNHWRSTNGYAAVPLDGIWIRGPYLHNGSVPTLEDLLEPVENRPKLFWRGYDLLLKDKVGFESYSDEAKRVGFRFDVSEPGNSNEGHLYGTDLSAEDKKALVEYMKTL
jgi:flagellar biogenesis protein FliO